MSARKDLTAALRTKLNSRKFDVKDTEELPDRLSKAVVLVRHRDYTPTPNPSHMFATFIVTVASQHISPDKAEDDLEVLLPQVLEALENHLGMTWTRCTKVLVKETYIGFDIDASIPIAKPY